MPITLDTPKNNRNADRNATGFTIPRNQWGWPVVPDPRNPSKTIACHRPSGFAKKMLTDDYSIKQWLLRCVAKGAGLRPDLATMASSLQLDTDKAELQRLADQMKDAGGGAFAANTGTAIHTVFEKAILGMPYDVAPNIAPQVEAMLACMEGENVRLVDDLAEPFIITADVPAAGSADGIVTINGGMPSIFDLKTGGDPRDFSRPLEYGVQMAIYANATHRWWGEGSDIEELPELDTTTGYILWCPSKHETGHAEIIPLDLTAAWQATLLAMDVRNMRRGIKRRFVMPSLGGTYSGGDLIDTDQAAEDQDQGGRPSLARGYKASMTPEQAERYDIKNRGILAKRLLGEAIDGTGADKGEFTGQWPANCPNLGSQLAKHTAETMDQIERFVALVTTRLDWVSILPEQREMFADRYTNLTEQERHAMDVWQQLENIPNLSTSRAKLYHLKLALIQMDNIEEQRS